MLMDIIGTGRVDDVGIRSPHGHRRSDALVSDVRGRCCWLSHDQRTSLLLCYVGPEEPSDELPIELRDWVRKRNQLVAYDLIQMGPRPPKTRSGDLRDPAKNCGKRLWQLRDTSTCGTSRGG